MSTLMFICWFLALICFGLAAFGVRRIVHFGWLGAAIIALGIVIDNLR